MARRRAARRREVILLATTTENRERNTMNRLAMLTTATLAIGTALPAPATAQTAKDLVGTWTNTSNVNIRQDGSRVDVFGPKGNGLAIFDGNGRFAIVNINPETPKFASNNRAQGTAEENKAAVLGGIALFGTYSVVDKVISFKVEGSTYPNWTGSEQKRNVTTFTPDQFTWTLPASIGGTAEVTWKRVK
jgi:Lipocalin-like domain